MYNVSTKLFLTPTITHTDCYLSNSMQLNVLNYSRTCVKQPLKIDKAKILMTNGRLMKVESIAECSPWSILQYF